MALNIIRNDITRVTADAIVNTANPMPVIGAGTDRAIYNAAGEEKLLEARKKIGNIKPGDAYVTPAFGLDAQFIIHTVGPVWLTGSSVEREVLRNCYLNSLELASQYKCKSIAFPLISSGSYGFPKDVAIAVARDAIESFLKDTSMDVYLVVYDNESLVASKGEFSEIREFIDGEYVKAREEVERSERLNRRRLEAISRNALLERPRIHHVNAGDSLDDLVGGKQLDFGAKFKEFFYSKKLDSTDVYKGYYDRKVYNKIMNVKKYHPSKGTAIMSCLGLRLSLTESFELLASASYAFNPNFDPDIIVMYCICHEIRQMRDINEMLERYGLPEFDLIY